MSTPGIGDPYWYEWFVGLERIVEMLNPENNISYVIFQSGIHKTIDDVVVGMGDEEEVCYQVKHEIGDAKRTNLTFNKLIQKEDGESLIETLAKGWKEAKEKEDKAITPILYTNRRLGVNKGKREFHGAVYTALPLVDFIEEIQSYISQASVLSDVEKLIDDHDLALQWKEFKESIGNDDIVLDFLKAFEIRSRQGSLDDFEDSLIMSLQETFRCNSVVAQNLFDKLCSNLRLWTTTRRENKEKITIENVFDVLALNNDQEYGEHELPFPTPFFKSREKFAAAIIENVKEAKQKVIWVSGEPGSGKTSLVSYLQLNHNLFRARYHTFKPISPEQRYYNIDAGLSKPEYLWNDLLIQLRKHFKGELSKYNIPVTNALCSIEQMRQEVMRLAKLLSKKLREKIVICIDGIDHAARAENKVTFLHSLFSPEEIPEGVVFVIVGQPSQLYEDYPLWLKTENEHVKHLHMPPLFEEDIGELLSQEKISLKVDKSILTRLIYNKTEGNNLSVVFAIEEAKNCYSIKDFQKILDEKYVSGDIQSYYDHIWKHVTYYLSQKALTINFSDKVIASAIILLNGRVNIEILSEAIDANLDKDDWEELLDLLFPLLQRINDDEYALFHNDFRVFLMANHSKGAKYRSIAFQLASYFMKSDYSIQGLMNIIPLLISADKKGLIPDVYNEEFIIHSLANGLSRKKILEYGIIAYESAVEIEDWKKFNKVYLAINTLNQHYNYYEYNERNYDLKDKSYVKDLNPFELRAQELDIENIDSYGAMLKFCIDLTSYQDPILDSRAKSTFNLWMKELDPSSFIQNIYKENEDIIEWNKLNEILEDWAYLANLYSEKYVEINKEVMNENEFSACVKYNDSYFKNLVNRNENDKALEVIEAGVSYDCIARQFKEILFKGDISKYEVVLQKLIAHMKVSNVSLLAHLCLITIGREPPQINAKDLEKIKYLSEENCFYVIIVSTIIGYQEYNNDIHIGISQMNQQILEIKKKDEDINYKYLKILMRHSFLLGRAIKEIRNYGFMNPTTNSHLLNSYKEFLTYDTKRLRLFTFHEGFKVLLFLSFNQKEIIEKISPEYFYDLIQIHLFNRNLLGMHYKSFLLDYLVKNNNTELVKEYLTQLYGSDAEKIFIESDFQETHNHFKKYGKIVMPEIIEEVDDKLKWDVVSYTGHKDYSLSPMLHYLDKITKYTPQSWKKEGLELYRLSCIASIKGDNRASSAIKTQINTDAARSGLNDLWEVRQQDNYFRYSLDATYDQLLGIIKASSTLNDLKGAWILSCGILSWYNREDREAIKIIYTLIVERGEGLNIKNIESTIYDLSPEYSKIALHKINNYQEQDTVTKSIDIEQKEIEASLYKMGTNELLDYLKRETDSYFKWDLVDTVWEIIVEREPITTEVAKVFMEITLLKLENYPWEYTGSQKIIARIFPILREELLWGLASHNKINLQDTFYLYACSSNMSLLLRYASELLSNDFTKEAFESEIACHYKWITGSNHFNVDMQLKKASVSNLRLPENTEQLIFNILMEQIQTRNIHRIEIALQGLKMLVKEYPVVLKYIADSWDAFSKVQKEYLFLMTLKWSKEKEDELDYIPCIEREDEKTNELDKKFFMFSILKNIKKNIGIKYTEEEIVYHLPKSTLGLFNESNISSKTNQFLSIMELITGESYDDIKYFIGKEKLPIPEDEVDANMTRPGDAMLLPNEYTELDMQVLYGEEKRRRWGEVPFQLKAQALCTVDDVWVLSDPPRVSYAESWNIEETIIEAIDERALPRTKSYLSKLLWEDMNDEESLLGGVVWYPSGMKDGVIYTESIKIIDSSVFIKNREIPKTFNKSSLAVHNITWNEELLSLEESLLNTGICLVNELAGSRVFIHGNTHLYPSSYLKDSLNITPSEKNPLVWINKEGREVLRFERITSPNRDAFQESYHRQPIVCRWVINKSEIEQLIRSRGLKYYRVNKIENMPKI